MYRLSKMSLSCTSAVDDEYSTSRHPFFQRNNQVTLLEERRFSSPCMPQVAMYCMPPKWHAETLTDKPRRIGADLNVEEKAISANVATSTDSHSTPPLPLAVALCSRFWRLVKATLECGYMVIAPHNIALVSKQPQTYAHALHGLLRRARCKT